MTNTNVSRETLPYTERRRLAAVTGGIRPRFEPGSGIWFCRSTSDKTKMYSVIVGWAKDRLGFFCECAASDRFGGHQLACIHAAAVGVALEQVGAVEWEKLSSTYSAVRLPVSMSGLVPQEKCKLCQCEYLPDIEPHDCPRVSADGSVNAADYSSAMFDGDPF